MGPLLYLDTARLGQTLPAARDAQIDFVRLTTEEPSSLYFEEFLKHGYAAWPDYYQHRFPGLSTWTGVAGLKQSLKQLAGAPDDTEVLLASRSLALVQMAATQMFQACRNVLCTDLSWSTYQDTVDHQAIISGKRTTVVPLRDFIFHHGWTADDVVNYLADAYEHHHCDGLFLPAVDHLGIRVPVKQVVDRIRQQHAINFTFIDAAQAFCQVPIDDDLQVADFLVTGCHKWMGAGQPMGVGFIGLRVQSCSNERTLKDHCDAPDSLLRFTHGLETGDLYSHSETVNLTALFASSGAATTAELRHHDLSTEALEGIAALHSLLFDSPDRWQRCNPVKELRSEITLFVPSSPVLKWMTPDQMRQHWLKKGYVLSAYTGGMIRLSAAYQRSPAAQSICTASRRHR